MKNSPQITAPFLVTNNLTYQSNRPTLQLSQYKANNDINLSTRKIQSLQRINTIEKQDLITKETDEEENILPDETLLNSEFRKRLEKIKNSMEIVRNPDMPIELKIRMMDSLKDSIRTHLNCVQEANKQIQEKMEYLSKVAEEKALQAQEELIAKANKIEVMKFENMEQEDALAKLRQTKNSLVVSFEDARDEKLDLEALINEKKRVLDNKLKYIEELKLKMSTEKPKRPPTLKTDFLTSERETMATTPGSGSSVTNKPVEIKPIETNTSIFQGVSSKLTGFVGGIFSKKPSKSILTPKVIQEISLMSKPTVAIEPKFLTRKRNISQSTADSTR